MLSSHTVGCVSSSDRQTNTPAGHLKSGREPSTRQLVLCAGDSITRGDVSADWVGGLHARYADRGYRFINAGSNGQLAWNVLQRMDEIIRCEPDVVTLMIGTNDVQGTFSADAERKFRKRQGIPQTPTLDWYGECVDAILGRLKAETNARIALLDIPILGEDLDSVVNKQVNTYNARLREIAAGHGLTCLPVHDRLADLLPSDHRPAPYEGKTGPIIKATLGHRLLRRSWDSVSARNGLVLLTDQIHLNDKAAAVVTEAVAEFLDATA